jgi:hypothetical protein
MKTECHLGVFVTRTPSNMISTAVLRIRMNRGSTESFASLPVCITPFISARGCLRIAGYIECDFRGTPQLLHWETDAWFLSKCGVSYMVLDHWGNLKELNKKHSMIANQSMMHFIWAESMAMHIARYAIVH